MTTRSIAVVASLALTGAALLSGAAPVSAEASDAPFERLCTAFLAEYVPAAEDGASPECHDDSNVTLDRFFGRFVDHTMFWAACQGMGFDGIHQTYSDLGTPEEHWVLTCTSDA